jgi:TonB family protein
LGKNLPSVHEDTKTVIVLQQGAVVRLTASLITGETVVLTNRMTGADVLCRVGNIKSQPGIQHYVDLEFMQRAPGFWGDTAAASNAPMATEPHAVAPAPAAVPGPIAAQAAIPLPPVPVSPPVPPPPPAAAASPPAPSPALVATPAPPPSPAPVADLPSAPAAQSIELAPLAEPVALSRKVSQAGSVTPIRSSPGHATLSSISAEGESYRAPRSHKALLGTAAGVLLLAGAAGGYWFYGRQTVASPPAPQQAAYVPPVPVLPDPVEASEAMEPEPASLGPSLESQMDVVIETHPSEDAAAVPVPAAPAAARTSPATARPPAPAARPPAPVARRSSVPIGQLQAPKAKITATRMDASEPPPVIVGAANLGDTGAADALLAAEPAGPAPPPVRVNAQPTVGGQLQQPQLISSVAPVYPPNARMQRIQGVVVLDALVDETGKVVETTVIAGPAPLLSAAQQAVRGWKYKPAELNGKPIAVHTKVSVRFALQ